MHGIRPTKPRRHVCCRCHRPGFEHSSNILLHQVTLHLQPPAWGLPTTRPDFLHVLTYCKLADVNFAVVPESKFGGSAMTDGKDDVPVMLTEQKAVVGANEIVKSLQDEGKDLDSTLSPQERAETHAFIAMLQGTLQTAMDCEWYLNDTNWFEVVKVTFTCENVRKRIHAVHRDMRPGINDKSPFCLYAMLSPGAE